MALTKTKIVVIVLAAVLVVAACVYFLTSGKVIYDYSHLLDTYYEDGGEFTALADARQDVAGMSLVSETDALKLYINTKTGEMAVYDKRGSETWYSNPVARMSDPMANPAEKSLMSSQLTIKYFDSQRKIVYYNSYDKCSALDQFKVESLPDGVRVIYTVGDQTLGVDLLPQYISEERMEELFISNLDEQRAKFLLSKYRASATKEGFRELQSTDRSSRINAEKLLAIFEEFGYTAEDLDYDNHEAGIDMELDRVYFEISLEYRIHNDTLSVTMPLDEITENGGGQIASIDIMQYFGAGGSDEEGYLLVPSGSGGLINFNNGKVREDLYSQPVYDVPPMTKTLQNQVNEPVRLPVFGIKKENGSFVAYISEGEGLAYINADISGKTGSYNYVYPSFTLRNADQLSMSSVTGTASDLTVLENRANEGAITVNYMFLPDNDAGYPEMAAKYREYLVGGGVLSPLAETDAAPFYLDIYGAAEMTKHVLGVPYTAAEPLTTYAQAETIAGELADRGVENIQMRYLGWFNDGINHDVAKNVKPLSVLGKLSQLAALDKKLSETGGAVYPDVQFQKVSYTSSGYKASSEASRMVSGYTAISATFSRITMRRDANYYSKVFYYNSPHALPSQIDSFINGYKKIGLQNISLRDLGDVLTADMDKKNGINRGTARLIVEEQIDKLAQNYQNVLISGGNQYALKYADHIVNAPVNATKFYILDEEIPFLEMVLHGYIDYTGSAFNTSDSYDADYLRLRMLEYGGAPYYAMTYETTDKFRYNAYEYLYTTYYEYWVDRAAENYRIYNEVYSKTRTSEMTGHINHGNGVYETVYANGISVYVNYGENDAEIGGVSVKAKDYAVGGYAK